MFQKKYLGTLFASLLGTLAAGPGCAGDFQDNADTQSFIKEMEQRHQFDRKELEALFEQAKKRDDILEAISRPAEKTKPWYEYRNIFLKPKRIDGGVSSSIAPPAVILSSVLELYTGILRMQVFYAGIPLLRPRAPIWKQVLFQTDG